MSNQVEEYRCHCCGFKTQTSARLNSHISQSPLCLEEVVAANRPKSNPRKRHRSESPPDTGDPTNNHPANEDLLYSSLLKGQPFAKRAHVEVEEDTPIGMRIVFDEFEPAAGMPQPEPVTKTLNDFEHLQEHQRALGSEPWAPFSSVEDWDYARWITNSDLSQKQIDAMLALELVRVTHLKWERLHETHKKSDKILLPIFS
jgi:hypothetical protein